MLKLLAFFVSLPLSAQEFESSFNGSLTWRSQNEVRKDKNLGFRTRENATIHAMCKSEEKVIYDAIYKTNSLGHRITPRKTEIGPEYFAIFMGCSFTYGIGVNQNETLPFFFSQEFPKFRSYNLGIPASAPNQYLRLLESADWNEGIKESKGIFFYPLIEAHLSRSNGFVNEMSWMGPTPNYEWKGEKLVLSGTMEKNFKFRKFLANYFQKPLIKMGKNWPWLKESHYLHTCRLVEGMKENFLKTYPKSKFVVLIHPLGKFSKLNPCFEEKGIEYWHIDLNYPGDQHHRYSFPMDSHPTPLTNKSMVDFMKGKMRKITF